MKICLVEILDLLPRIFQSGGDFSPLFHSIEKEDPEYPDVKLNWDDYYPALGDKRIVVHGMGSGGVVLDGEEISAEIISPDIPEVYFESPSVIFENGKAEFFLSAQTLVPPLEGEMPSGLVQDEIQVQFSIAGQTLGDLQAAYNVRNNSNTTLQEVLDGEAVFVYDDPADDPYDRNLNHVGVGDLNYDNVNFNVITEADDLKMNFIQSVMNQTIPRKRNIVDYEILLENGVFGPEVENTLYLAKEEFNIGVNTSSVDTSETFRKLMKDYGHDYNQLNWLHRIIDKETLVLTGFNSADQAINDGSSVIETGLLELFTNVVHPFLANMILGADTYRQGTSGNYGMLDYKWTARTGEQISQGDGISYCFGCKQEVSAFNITVSPCGAGARWSVLNSNYKGNVNPQNNCQIDENIPEGTSRYPGLYREEYLIWLSHILDNTKPAHPEYDPAYWSGVDCSGLACNNVQDSIASFDSPNASEIGVSSGISGLNSCQIFYTDEVCSILNMTCPIFEPSGHTYNFSPTDDDLTEMVRYADLVSYRGHVSIVNKNPENDGTYQIVHASGERFIDYNNNKVIDEGEFSRKVLTNDNKWIKAPLGFGRIKLWD